MGIAASGEELFVGGDLEAVDLAVGAAECAAVYAGWGFPEAYFVVIGGSGEYDAHGWE